MEEVLFTEEDYIKMEAKSKKLLGWSLSEKCGMNLRSMIENPDKGIQCIKDTKQSASLIVAFKLSKVLELLEDPNWKSKLKKYLG